MATALGITLVKRFPYRDNPVEEYSNSYWFKPVTAPADDTAWLTLMSGIIATERPLFPSSCEIIRGYGYTDDTGHKPGDTGTVAPAVFSVDFRVAPHSVYPGTLSLSGAQECPGDDAVWCRWKTERRTSPGGKPIYLRKFFHPAAVISGGTDAILPAQKTALLAHATALSDGSLVGSRTITTAGRLDTILSTGASSYVTTRTLKRRGRRP